MGRPLEGITVVDFSQFLSGPSAGLRMADLGARVIKIERPETGDICRKLYISNLELDGESTLFHSINRNKESFAVDLKNPKERVWLDALLRETDVMIQNFRPGVIEKLNLSYDDVRKLNPSIIYGSISGYGNAGPWQNKPGQDLLVQSYSGLVWQTGRQYRQQLVPMGLSLVDMLVGANTLQGVLACLVRRGITGEGGHIEVSMLETAIDMHAARWLVCLNQEGRTATPDTFNVDTQGNNARPAAYLTGAGTSESESEREMPPGIYKAKDGYFALTAAHNLPEETLLTKPVVHWLVEFAARGIDCCPVFTWNYLMQEKGFQALDMVQRIYRSNGSDMFTLRCPIRIDGEVLKSPLGSPMIGEHNSRILQELGFG